MVLDLLATLLPINWTLSFLCHLFVGQEEKVSRGTVTLKKTVSPRAAF